MNKKLTPLDCDPREIALKSFFLGPQAENAGWLGELLSNSFDRWVRWRKSLFPSDGCAISEKDVQTPEFIKRKLIIENTVSELLTRFSSEVPKHSPRYLGHMFSEVSIPALVGHIITLLHNPNNISGESSRVGIGIEDEAIQYLLKMVGYPTAGQGHFTSGGTIANFEGLIRARARSAVWLSAAAASNDRAQSGKNLDLFRDAHLGWDRFNELYDSSDDLLPWNYAEYDPWAAKKRIEALYQTPFHGPILLIPENKHYSWKKGCNLLGFGASAYWPVELDGSGRISVNHLKKQIIRAALEKKPIAMIVSVVGTTEMGSIDPVHEVQDLLDTWKKKEGIHLWHHVDAAYGGFLCSMNRKDSKVLSAQSAQALERISGTNSITIDPHKLGYVPYASGTFLVRDLKDYYYQGASDAPYLDYDQAKDKGPFTIEGSRSAAGAVATWMTAKTMGFDPEGYGLLLERTFRLAQQLITKMQTSGLSVEVAPGLDSNLVCFSCTKKNEKLSESNDRTLRVYQAFSPKTDGPFIVSKTTLNWNSYGAFLDEWTRKWDLDRDVDEVVLIRMSIMNPFLGSHQMNVNFLDLFTQEIERLLK